MAATNTEIAERQALFVSCIVNLTTANQPITISCGRDGFTIDCDTAGTTVGCPSCPIKNGKWYFEVLLKNNDSAVAIGWGEEEGNSCSLSSSKEEYTGNMVRDGQISRLWKVGKHDLIIVAIGTAIDMDKKIVSFYLKDHEGIIPLLYSTLTLSKPRDLLSSPTETEYKLDDITAVGLESLFPCVSLLLFGSVTIHFGFSAFTMAAPDGYMPYAHLLLQQRQSAEEKKGEKMKEKQEEDGGHIEKERREEEVNKEGDEFN